MVAIVAIPARPLSFLLELAVASQALRRPAGCPAHTPRLRALVRVSRGARVLEHRTRRPVLSPCPSHARPARVRSQVCSVSISGYRYMYLV